MQTPQGPCSEPLEFLSALYNGEMRPVLLPMQDLGAYLPYRRVSFGQETVELGPGRAPSPRSFVGMVSIKDYPGQTAPGMLDELLRLPFELIVSQSFGFVDRQAALSRMNLALRRMRSAEDEAVSLRADLANAKDEVAAGRAGFGEHHMTIAVRGDTPAAVDDGVAEVQAALADLGIIAVREEIALEPAFWAQFPGNFKYIARRGLVSTGNFAGLASGHNFPLGQAEGNHWGEAVTLLETTAAGPYYFNFHQGDLGNFTVIGPSGSGKTVVLNFLLAQARKFAPAHHLLRQGSRRRALHPRDRRPLRSAAAGHALGPQPAPARRQSGQPPVPDRLARPARGRRRHRRDRADQGCGRRQFRASRSSIAACAISPNCSAAASGRTAPTSGRGCGPGGATASAPGCSTTSATGPTSSAEAVGFDMTQILDDPAMRTPGDDVPVPPGRGAAGRERRRSSSSTKAGRRWTTTSSCAGSRIGRRRSASATASSASPPRARRTRSKAGSPARSSSRRRPRSSWPIPRRAPPIISTASASPRTNIELVRTLPDNAHCFLIKHGAESVVARLNLTGERDLLTILSGRERTVRLLDEIRAETRRRSRRLDPAPAGGRMMPAARLRARRRLRPRPMLDYRRLPGAGARRAAAIRRWRRRARPCRWC